MKERERERKREKERERERMRENERERVEGCMDARREVPDLQSSSVRPIDCVP